MNASHHPVATSPMRLLVELVNLPKGFTTQLHSRQLCDERGRSLPGFLLHTLRQGEPVGLLLGALSMSRFRAVSVSTFDIGSCSGHPRFNLSILPRPSMRRETLRKRCVPGAYQTAPWGAVSFCMVHQWPEPCCPRRPWPRCHLPTP